MFEGAFLNSQSKTRGNTGDLKLRGPGQFETEAEPCRQGLGLLMRLALETMHYAWMILGGGSKLSTDPTASVSSWLNTLHTNCVLLHVELVVVEHLLNGRRITWMCGVRKQANLGGTDLIIPIIIIRFYDAKLLSSNHHEGNSCCFPCENYSERESKLSRLVKFASSLRLAWRSLPYSIQPSFIEKNIICSLH